MATPISNSKLKTSYEFELKKAKEKSENLHNEIMRLLDIEAPVEKTMKVRDERNEVLILIQTLESRINNLGKNTGIIEQSIPNLKN